MFVPLILAVNCFVAFGASKDTFDVRNLLPKKFLRQDNLQKLLKNRVDSVNAPAEKKRGVATKSTYSEGRMISLFEKYDTVDCSNKPWSSSGNLYNECLVNAQPDFYGAVHGSGLYNGIEESWGWVRWYYTEFPSNECSGSASYGESPVYPETCYYIGPQEDGFGTQAIKMVFVNESNLAGALPAGLMFTYFDTTEHCADDSYPLSSYDWIGMNVCLNNDDGVSSWRVTDCHEDNFVVEWFDQQNCQGTMVYGIVNKSVCAPNTEGAHSGSYNNYYYQSFVSHRCT